MKRLAYLLFLIGATVSTSAQTSAISSPIPASPNAVSFAKYGEIPVNLSTGIPNISFPLYEIRSGQISVPISLSYHAGGIKVEEFSSWVGLGWTLHAGGAIIRSVRGVPDEGTAGAGGFKTIGYKVDEYASLTTFEKQEYLNAVLNGNYDSEPDMFIYSFGGYSGKFMFANDGSIITMPTNNLKIIFIDSVESAWEIIDPDGTKYFFREREVTTTTSWSSSTGSGWQGETFSLGGFVEGAPEEVTTAWYLTKIEDVFGHTVNFEYEEEQFTFRTIDRHSGTRSLGGSANCPPASLNYVGENSFSYSNNYILGRNLLKITFNGGEVDFLSPYVYRTDLPGANVLSKMQIKNVNNIVKEFTFGTSYFNESGSYQRLRLDSFSQTSPDSAAITHRFEYHRPYHLPSVMSFSQDHWGYYNGAPNTSLLTYKIFDGSTVNDREPHAEYAQIGTLNKIIYPTGGYSLFEYESNSVKELYQQKRTDSTVLVSFGGNNYSSDDPEIEFQQTFTISNSDLAGSSAALYRLDIYENIYNNLNDDIPNVTYVLDSSGTTILYGEKYYLANDTIFLHAGTYTLKATIHNPFPTSNTDAAFTVGLVRQHITPSGWYSSAWGGLRIKSIKNFAHDSLQADAKFYKYNIFDSSLSSGMDAVRPIYEYPIQSTVMTDQCPGMASPCITMDVCYLMLITTSSNYPLSSTAGSPVYYTHVTEEIGLDASGGKKQTVFTDFPDYHHTSFPFAPTLNKDYKRGMPLVETTFKRVGNSFIRVMEEEYLYYYSMDHSSTYGQATKEINCLKAAIRQRESVGIPSPPWMLGELTWYSILAEFTYLQEKKTRVYSSLDTALFAETITSYEYGLDHFLPTKIETINSKGQTLKTVNKYAHEMKSNTIPNVYNDMVARHIWSPIIEASQFNNNTFLESAKVNYDYWNSTGWGHSNSSIIVLRSLESKVKNQSPETRVEYQQYDQANSGRVVTAAKVNDVKKTYVYDYYNEYAVAEVSNATSENVAYSSFEADGKGNWNYSGSIATDPTCPTGNRCYNLTTINTITKSTLNPETSYIISYWRKNGSALSINGSITVKTGKTIDNWTYYEHQITGITSVTISGTAYIDEVRLYPKGALMNTYTYAPLVGMTSQCDINNRILYYEYDGLGRLQTVRDADKKIVKMIEYKYQTNAQN